MERRLVNARKWILVWMALSALTCAGAWASNFDDRCDELLASEFPLQAPHFFKTLENPEVAKAWRNDLDGFNRAMKRVSDELVEAGSEAQDEILIRIDEELGEDEPNPDLLRAFLRLEIDEFGHEQFLFAEQLQDDVAEALTRMATSGRGRGRDALTDLLELPEIPPAAIRELLKHSELESRIQEALPRIQFWRRDTTLLLVQLLHGDFGPGMRAHAVKTLHRISNALPPDVRITNVEIVAALIHIRSLVAEKRLPLDESIIDELLNERAGIEQDRWFEFLAALSKLGGHGGEDVGKLLRSEIPQKGLPLSLGYPTAQKPKLPEPESRMTFGDAMPGFHANLSKPSPQTTNWGIDDALAPREEATHAVLRGMDAGDIQEELNGLLKARSIHPKILRAVSDLAMFPNEFIPTKAAQIIEASRSRDPYLYYRLVQGLEYVDEAGVFAPLLRAYLRLPTESKLELVLRSLMKTENGTHRRQEAIETTLWALKFSFEELSELR